MLAFLLWLLAPACAVADVGDRTVAAVWQRISAAAGLPESPVHFEDAKEPNAWIAFGPNRQELHVTRSLIALLKSEDEMAGILAHEAGHIKLGHYGNTVGRNLAWTLLATLFRGDRVGETIAGVGIGLAESGFSREQEVEADDYGVRLSVKAGYSPWGLLRAMERMKNAGFTTSPNGFNSHPPTERRLQRLRETAAEADRNR
jgi:putative metalloprotease